MDWLTHCFHCGVALPQPEQAAQAEIAHISYILWQLPWMCSRNLLTPDAEAKLYDEYTRRQSQIGERLALKPANAPASPLPAAPIVPPLPFGLLPATPSPPFAPSVASRLDQIHQITASQTPVLAAGHSTLSWPLFAFLFVQSALIWMGVGAVLKDRTHRPDLAAPLLNEAKTFWWAGLMVTLTPAFLTHWTHAPTWHSALLLSECVVYVLWGVAQRIRAFVAAGLGTVVLYGASVSLGILPDTLTTIAALLAGVGLFVFGFYALTHQEAMKRLAANIQRRWTVRHSWR